MKLTHSSTQITRSTLASIRFFKTDNPTLLLLFLTVFLTGLGSSVVRAETNPNEALKRDAAQSSGEMTLDTLDNKIKSITEKQGLDESVKTKVIALYQSTKEHLEDMQWFKAQTAIFQEALKSSALKNKEIQAEITKLETELKNNTAENRDTFQNIPTDELEQRYILEKSKLSDLDSQINKLEADSTAQNNRPQQIRTEILNAKQALDAAQQKFESKLNEAQSKPELEALQLNLKTTIDARNAELKMYDFESISNPIRSQLLKINLQLLSLKKQALEPTISEIEQQLAQQKQLEASKMREELSQVEKELRGKPPVIQAITRENIQYSRNIQAIVLKLEQYSTQKTKIDNQAATIDTNFKSAEKKISLAGLSPALGKILREQRRNLSIKDDFYLKSEAIQTETAQTSLEQFKAEDRLKQLNDIDSELNRLVNEQVDASLSTDLKLRIKAELRVLLNNQKDLLDKLSGLYGDYLRTLGDLDFARQQLFSQAKNYASYLDKRLLWIPSSMPIGTDYPFKIYQSGKWLISPANWLTATKDTAKTFKKEPILGALAFISLIVLRFYKTKFKKLIDDNNNKVSRPATDHFYYTLQNLALTLILVAPFALLLYYLGWFLSTNLQLSSFSKAVGTGLRDAAVPLFFLQFFYHLFTPDGVARKHFHWRKSTINLIREQIYWFTFLMVPSVFLVHMTNAYENVAHTDSIGRLALIISLLCMSLIFANLLHPKNEILPKRIRENTNSWLNKLRFIWYPGIIAVPLIIIGFAATGYYLSALELQEKLIITTRIVFSAIIIHQIVVRWLMIVNRQLAIQNARQAELLASENRTSSTGQAGNPEALISVEGEQVARPTTELLDIPAINAQTLRILNVVILLGLFVSCWMVWQNIVPAFSFLNQVELWQTTELVDNQPVSQPITLTNLIFAGLLIFIAFITMRNLAGVIELVVFRHISIEPGSRYAIIQLSKYVILSMALILVANQLGGSWSQVQWLAAALSVGLGFGLQEIFGNLVSGIILLFERPIRVGDYVTVGNVSGVVNRIQMRATTLTDVDQKELIVPNKTFLTSQLINWTLTDSVTRVVIPVGIAYGSNVELALTIMLDTIKSIPQVLSTPAPSALFLGFGESSLDLSVRMFVPNVSERLPATHEFHLRLDQAFREHDINLPFPQRDIHIYPMTQDACEINP